ncbi:MAG: peroxiredoxin family protein [Fimbriimonadaceae bacterium]|nr:peroxiredoxin family protein [Fimbriimonadaceae bacterium]
MSLRPLSIAMLSVSAVLVLGASALIAFRPAGTLQSEGTADVRHPVTAEMKLDAESRRGEKAPDFTLPDQDGRKVSLAGLLKEGPQVLVMTKDGCPCSLESQPYFNALATAYAGRAGFIGLIDADLPIAQLYRQANLVPYPLLSETKETAFRAYRAEQSVYVFLIGRDGRIRHVWPGYSRAMLQELDQAIAEEAGGAPLGESFEGATEKMTSGCYFFEEDPAMTPSQAG